METVSILFGSSFQLIWKLFLDWYPNQMETVSILEICFQIKWKPLLPFWILLRVIQNELVTAISGKEYVVVYSGMYGLASPNLCQNSFGRQIFSHAQNPEGPVIAKHTDKYKLGQVFLLKSLAFKYQNISQSGFTTLLTKM